VLLEAQRAVDGQFGEELAELPEGDALLGVGRETPE